MTVNASTARNNYSGNGITTEFSYTFRILDEDDVKVTLTDADGVETIQTITTHYTVAGVGDDGGGSVTMVTAPATGESLTLTRGQTFDQQTDYTEGDPFPAETHENALDKLTMSIQQLAESDNRSIKVGVATDVGDLRIPTPEANKVLAWNDAGTNLTNSTPDADAAAASALAAASSASSAAGSAATAASIAATFDDEYVAESVKVGLRFMI